MAEGLLHQGLELASDQFGDRVALVTGDESLTFSMLDRRANSFARFLASCGVRTAERVAVMMGNRPEFVIAVYAISKLGASAVLLNPAWKAFEVRHALSLTDAGHAVAEGVACDVLIDTLGAGTIDIDGRSATQAVTSEVSGRAGSSRVTQSRDALLVFSSGTTGMPKAARHTHASFQHAIRHWVSVLGLGPNDRFQVATPPSHILGLLNLAAAISAGASVRLHRRFDLDELLRRVQTDRMTLEMAVAPIALAMANHPRLESYDLSSLRYIMWGATPVTPSVAEAVTARTGVRWLPAYGASELPVLAANPVNEPSAWRLDSAGLPAPGVALRVADLQTGEILPAGGIGEIQASSPSVMAGYLPEEATSAAFSDGWYRTGDVGWLEPDGWVHLTDRAKEMIKVKGFQVAPAEIEAVLLGQAGVVDCAVFGVADRVAGELPVAAVQLAAESGVSADRLQQLVAESLASYKRLRAVVVVDSIPRLPSGKVLRRTLRAEWEPRLGDPSARAVSRAEGTIG